MTKNIDNLILRRAINQWGEDAQIDMIIEECLELALALQSLKRKSKDRQETLKNVIDEIADVKIIIEQACIIFPRAEIYARIDFKMNRLAERLENKKFNL